MTAPAQAVALSIAPIGDAETRSFHENLVETIREEFHRGNDREVIRVGEALSRPLFESGAFSVRLDIGRMVEEAAARSERRRVQYVALIDEIGWSLVELGRYEEATRQILHGMRILESPRVLSPLDHDHTTGLEHLVDVEQPDVGARTETVQIDVMEHFRACSIDVVQDGVTGALDTNLARAAERALRIDPLACRERALRSSWDACTREFESNLVPCRDLAAGQFRVAWSMSDREAPSTSAQ